MTEPRKINVKYVESKFSAKVKKTGVKKVMDEKSDAEGCTFC